VAYYFSTDIDYCFNVINRRSLLGDHALYNRLLFLAFLNVGLYCVSYGLWEVR
jgi:hypothetical protein